MKAFTHTPADIFGNSIRYVIPLFQRPYVWTEQDQWQPLWEDVQDVAERIITAPPAAYGTPPVPPHFLGAIVVEQHLAPVAHIGVRHVIDGQQRLTTLQLLLDAAQWVVEQHGTPMDSQALQVLIENNPLMAQSPDDVFKVWPTDRDQDAFRAAMNNDTVVPANLSGSRIAQAHSYFVQAIEEWADVSADPEGGATRLNALTHALRDHLRLVVIDLEPGDNAQVIFETLNHRGSPLLASDLVKNLVFQVATAQDLDVQDLYVRYWRDLDSDYWRQSVAQGRLFRPRIDVFLNRWLTMKLLREVPTDRVFADFRDHIVGNHPDMTQLLAELATDARIHQQMEQLPLTTPEGRFYYRVLQAMDTQVVGTYLMWLLRFDEGTLPREQRLKSLSSVESWLVRRALCRATSKDHNRMVLELLKELNESGPATAGDTTERFLAGQSADSRYWPNDQAVVASLTGEPLYKSLNRARLRMVLEALEDALRGPLGEGQACPQNLTIEHIMPQAWREHWGSDIALDEIAGLRRDRLIHTLGNLTLVNARLNPTLSNRPWTDSVSQERGLGDVGKRSYLLGHSQLSLNSSLVVAHEDGWNEDDIRQRAAQLIELVTSVWLVPEDAHQPVAASSRSDDSTVATLQGKYVALRDWLVAQEIDEIRLTFAEVEEILGDTLPNSAQLHLAHWYSAGGSALARGIQDAGWRARNVSLGEKRATFCRLESDQPGEEAQEWGPTAEDVDAARFFWRQLSGAARGLFTTLMDASPDRVTAAELAERNDIPNGALGVAGVLAWPGRYAAQVGRRLPSRWEAGDPARYWMDESTATLFRSIADEPK